MPSLDLVAQNLSTFQTNQQLPGVTTLASAATIAPTTFLTVVTGVGPVNTVIPPATGMHMLMFIPNAALALGTTGNIAAAVTGAANVPIVLVYNPATQEYTAGSLRATATAG